MTVGTELDTLTGDDELAIALASGLSVSEAARRAGIGRATAYRRIQDPAFRMKILEHKQDLIDRIVGSRLTMALTAAAKLNQIAHDETVPLATRVRCLMFLASNPLALDSTLTGGAR